MRTLLIGSACVVILAASVCLNSPGPNDKVQVQIKLTDADTGKPITGIVRAIRPMADDVAALPGLYNRLKGIEKSTPHKGWHVVPAGGAKTGLPRENLIFEAVSGLETSLARLEIDLRKQTSVNITLKLRDIFQLKNKQLAAGNTHLHLRNMTLKQSDEYLRSIPPADNLDVLFLSYLERHKDDLSYITNKYPIGDLKQFDITGVLINNGEEHRHNFKGYGAGYGHVMLLDIKRLTDPVSIGPGIMAKGFDDQPLRVGIDDARKQGGTIIWCHNSFGYEDVLNALTGRLHAINVFDGSRRDTYEDAYYHYLNIGLRLPISTGTDWFMYDFSRVYAKAPGKLTIKSWLEAVKKGRIQATNGPLLSLTVDGKEIGDTINLKEAKTVRIEAHGIGRQDFGRLQLVHNGKVVQTKITEKRPDRFVAQLSSQIRIDEPGWFAVRIDTKKKNEFGKALYAHSSPIYVRMNGKGRFNVDSARELLRQMEEGKAAIKSQGLFSNTQAMERVLAMYDQGMEKLRRRVNAAGK